MEYWVKNTIPLSEPNDNVLHVSVNLGEMYAEEVTKLLQYLWMPSTDETIFSNKIIKIVN